MLQRLYDRVLILAGHRHAVWWLFVMAAAEASFFPIPVEVMMLPMMFAAPRKAWLFAGVATVGTVIGGVGGYAIGALLYDTLGQPILALYGHEDAYDHFAKLYDEWGVWIVFAGGFTPIPYKVVTIASGVAHLDLMVFVLASVVSRGLRFLLEAALLHWFGPPIRNFIEKRMALVATVSFVVAIAGFVAVKWLL
ncbi:MAG: DedA family protein [Alphaproteobacteria bacterium]|jgi:membrane protein YqaA with SNARE-associated domain|nr:DedA family protein [Rhodospirillaceae bacterium]MBT6203847.1 DedA family protein [Rhodospirillaceae bacterium]MBT6513034.1 DedA family protein [Rhodospirillaceae bacterium]MBT7612168.1 DedA family protein [Rhodospirillaceae bacterium]MDG2482832.1 DedA family protein [Alphaproteobacteria bacterium]